MELSLYNRPGGWGWVDGFTVGGLPFVKLVVLRADGNEAFRLASVVLGLVFGASDLCRACLTSDLFVEIGRTVL